MNNSLVYISILALQITLLMGWTITQAFELSSSSPNIQAKPDEMIIRFTEKHTQEQALQWGKENDLQLVKSLNIGDAFVYNCSCLDSCLEQSKEAYNDPEVKFAYPNLIRIDQITWSPPSVLENKNW